MRYTLAQANQIDAFTIAGNKTKADNCLSGRRAALDNSLWGSERGQGMNERRKNKRTGLNSKLIIKRLDDSMHQEVEIEVIDVSKSGVGFTCNVPLKIGAVYESFLTIWTREVIHAFLQIVRIELKGVDRYVYGASFVGMPEMDAQRIEVYQTISENDK